MGKQGPRIGLSTSCSKFLKKFFLISQKVAQMVLKKSQKLLSEAKVAQNFLKKRLVWCKTFKFYIKSNISKLFCAILRCNQRCLITLCSIKTKKCIILLHLQLRWKDLNDLTHLRHLSQYRPPVPHWSSSPVTGQADSGALVEEGERAESRNLAPSSQEIPKLSTKTLGRKAEGRHKEGTKSVSELREN